MSSILRFFSLLLIIVVSLQNLYPIESTASHYEYSKKSHLTVEYPDIQKEIYPQSNLSNPVQIIKGKVIDRDSKIPLPGVTVILDTGDVRRGTMTDENGYFRFLNVTIGRHSLIFSSIGYESKTIPGILLGSGKETVLSIELLESVVELEEVSVTYTRGSEAINKLAVVSGRSVSAYDIENIAGSMSDISRTVQSFPGVLSSNDGQNHIVIRGNSPKGLQWRLEGIEIPNLNHFSNIGASGGGIGIISNNMIASSDFLTGAFPAEYGNALSGVFDLRLRTGNTEKHEQTVQVGLMGTELMLEGPINRETNTSYIAHYRYSTFKIIQKLGADLRSVPDFQDISFKIYHPTKRMGLFSIFGIGGLSHEEGQSGYLMNSNMSTVGISNSLTLDSKTFLKTTVAISGWSYTWDETTNIGTEIAPVDRVWKTSIKDYTIKAAFNLNRKINAKHKIKAGLVLEQAYDDSYMGWYSDTLHSWFLDPVSPYYLDIEFDHSLVDDRNKAVTLQSYLNWNFRLNEKLTLNTGIHFLQFYLNNNYSLEPRLSIQWEVAPGHILSAGFGVHSRKESITLYAGRMTLWDGAVIQPNLDLELTKARHYVLGYTFLMTDLLSFKAEAYYQDIFDIPADPFPPYSSTINNDYGFTGNLLVNYGRAYNTGLEMTLERRIQKGYHMLLNATIYESKYIDKSGNVLDTKYNGSYSSNAQFGKEFLVGRSRQNILSFNTRVVLFGGMRYLPIDRELTLENGYLVQIPENGFIGKYPDYFRVDLLIKFTRNHERFSSEWSLDIMNLTNRKNLRYEYWDNSAKDFRNEYQNPFIPIINYRIQF